MQARPLALQVRARLLVRAVLATAAAGAAGAMRRDTELLIRCLKLEAENHALRASGATVGRQGRRVVTRADVAEMQTLEAQGLDRATIAARTGWAPQTVWRHTHVR